MGIEDPDADVAEQRSPVVAPDDEVGDPTELPLEADPVDVAGQQQVVPEDEEEQLR